MSKKVGKGLIAMVLAITLIGFVGSAAAQEKAADNMDLVKEKAAVAARAAEQGRIQEKARVKVRVVAFLSRAQEIKVAVSLLMLQST